MEIVWAAVIVAVALVWTAGVLAAARYGDRRVFARRRVLVNLKSGEGIEGVVTYAGREVLILADARIHDPASTGPVRADGEVIVDRANVSFTQRSAMDRR